MCCFLLLPENLASANMLTAEILAKRKLQVDPIQNILISKVNCQDLTLFPGSLQGIIGIDEINNKKHQQIV